MLINRAGELHFPQQRLGNSCTVCAIPLFTKPVERRALCGVAVTPGLAAVTRTHARTHVRSTEISDSQTLAVSCGQGEGSQSPKRMNLLNLSSPSRAVCVFPLLLHPPPPPPPTAFFKLLSLFQKSS